MSKPSTTFLLDANVFIEAHRRYYSFDVCPGFWKCLLHHTNDSAIFSIDRIKIEIVTGDALGSWIKNSVPKTMFLSTDGADVSRNFMEMMQWVQTSNQFKEEAKAEFAQVADGWLIAYAKTHGFTVVTQEVYNAEIKKSVPIPNVCKKFNVNYIDTFAMLRSLDARFMWEKLQ